MSTPEHYRSKTLATWLAALFGTLGLHRFYLRGLGDPLGWALPLPLLAGLYGVWRVRALGQDDRLAWVLLPVLGFTVALAMGTAIVYGLTPDERWDARHNPGRAGRATGWGPVLGVIFAMIIGVAALMSSIAYSGQRFFEWQLAETPVTATGR